MDLNPVAILTADPLICPTFAYARKFALRSYNTFINNLNGDSINKYFSVDCLDMTLTQQDTLNYTFHIEYKNTYPDLIKLDIPYDAIKLIKSYVERRFILNINIFFVKDSPFKPPLWSPITITTHNFKQKDFEHMIKRHYQENRHDWSPFIMIEKDILYFIERIMRIL